MRGLSGSVDPEPALLGAGELELILFHPPRPIDPRLKAPPGFLGQPPHVDVVTRILLVLEKLPQQPAALYHNQLGVGDGVIVAGIHQVPPPASSNQLSTGRPASPPESSSITVHGPQA
jgi:hypothetical protein